MITEILLALFSLCFSAQLLTDFHGLIYRTLQNIEMTANSYSSSKYSTTVGNYYLLCGAGSTISNSFNANDFDIINTCTDARDNTYAIVKATSTTIRVVGGSFYECVELTV